LSSGVATGAETTAKTPLPAITVRATDPLQSGTASEAGSTIPQNIAREDQLLLRELLDQGNSDASATQGSRTHVLVTQES
jgi:hypothetical protein